MNEALKALTRGETDEERKKRIQKEEEAEQRAAEAAKRSPYQRFCKRIKTPTRKKIGSCGKVPQHIGCCGSSLKIWTITTLWFARIKFFKKR